MKRYDYLIIGGGMAADAAVQGIRSLDPGGSIGMLSSEPDAPYRRPPLSKDLWNGKTKVEDIDCDTYSHNIDFHSERTAVRINRAELTVSDQHHDTYGYRRLLLATGGRPRSLTRDDVGVIHYRTLEDYRTLINDLDNKEHYAVAGGGFIGCEMAAALRSKEKKVSLIFPEDTLGGGRFLLSWLRRWRIITKKRELICSQDSKFRRSGRRMRARRSCLKTGVRFL